MSTAAGTQTPPNVKGEQKPASAAQPAEHAKSTIPDWAADARWYQVVASRFHNGDRSNDPGGTLPWTSDWPKEGDAAADPGKLAARQYGGDLQGLQQRLPYLKQLGVNAICLTSIFRTEKGVTHDVVDLRHVDDALGVKDSLAQLKSETPEPRSWKFSATDRIFLAFLEKAHKSGFRVALEAAFANVSPTLVAEGDFKRHLLGITRRWMDPNGDGDPSDGVDGWVLGEPDKLADDFWKRWRILAKRLNPDVLLIGDIEGDPSGWLGDRAFDVTINHKAAEAIGRFFALANKTYSLKDLFGDLAAGSQRYDSDAQLAAPIRLSSPETGRLLSVLLQPASAAKDSATSKPTREAIARWRLARVFQFFYPGAPMIYYGEELGMLGGKGPLAFRPMPWKGLPNVDSKSADHRDDLASLIQWLNIRRDKRAPLRRGAFRPVILDDKRRVFAFARSLASDEVILVANYGSTKQKVMLPAGKPGQLIGVLGPQFDAASSFPRRAKKPAGSPKEMEIGQLRMGGNRQFVNPEGQVRLWLDPMSVRVVLVSDKEPW